MTSYTTLTGAKTLAGSIKWLVNYERLDTEGILTDAQAYIYGSLRVREMKKSDETLQLDALFYFLNVPSDLLDPIKLRARYGDIINVDEATLFSMQIRDETTGLISEGDPSYYAIYDEDLTFDTTPTEDLNLQLLYYARPAALSSGNTTNWLTTRYPNIVRHACQYFAYLQMENDAQAERHKSMTDELIGRANVEADLVRRGSEFGVTVR